MTSAQIGPPPEDSIIVFAGYAGITDVNLETQLSHWLPQDLALGVPAVQKNIPRGSAGASLRAVLAWLKGPGKFRESDIDRPDDLTAYITDLDSPEAKYLVVLWGDGGDKETEELVDAASRYGFTVLDLTDGLDELKLGDNQPEPPAAEPEPEPETAPRRRRRTPSAEAPVEAAEEPAHPPWENGPEPLIMPAGEVALVKWLVVAFEGAAAALRQQLPGTVPSQPASRADISPPQDSAPQAEPETPAEMASTRAWLLSPDINPDIPERYPAEPGKYHLKGRGRPRTAMKDWNEIQLTPAQEKKLGLTS